MKIYTLLLILSFIGIIFCEQKNRCPCFAEDTECPNVEHGWLCVYTFQHTFNVTFQAKADPALSMMILERIYGWDNGVASLQDDYLLLSGKDDFIERNAELVYVCSECDELHKLNPFTVERFRAHILSKYIVRTPSFFIQTMRYDRETGIEFYPIMKNDSAVRFYDTTDGCYGKYASKPRLFYRPSFKNQTVCLIEYTMRMWEGEVFTHFEHINDGLLSKEPSYGISHMLKYGPRCRAIINGAYENLIVVISCVCTTRACVEMFDEKQEGFFCLNGAVFDFDANGNITAYVREEWLKAADTKRCVVQVIATPQNKTVIFSALPQPQFPSSDEAYVNITSTNTATLDDDDPPKLDGNVTMTFYEDEQHDLRHVYDVVHFALVNEYLGEFISTNTCAYENFLQGERFAHDYVNDFPCFYYFSIFAKKLMYPVPTLNAYPVRFVTVDNINVTVFVDAERLPEHVSREYGVYAAIESKQRWDNTTMPTEETLDRLKRFFSLCPKNINETHIELNHPSSIYICGIFIQGITWKGKGVNLGWRPNKVYFKPLEQKDLYEWNLDHKVNRVQCAFNKEKILTMCTCAAELGDCHEYEYFARLHIARYSTLNENIPQSRHSWGFDHLRAWKRKYFKEDRLKTVLD